MWRDAQDELLKRLDKGNLPKLSIAAAAKLIGHKPGTTRTAVHKSPTLMAHFGLSDAKAAPKPSIIDEVISRANPQTRRYLQSLDPDARQETEAWLADLEPDKRLEAIRTLAENPDAGQAADATRSQREKHEAYRRRERGKRPRQHRASDDGGDGDDN